MELLIDTVLNIGADEFYRASRYTLPLVVMLVNSENKNMFDVLENNVRQTDIVQQLSAETAVVFLSHTNYEQSLNFLNKIKNQFNFTYTLGEYKGSEYKFIENLALENEQKIS